MADRNKIISFLDKYLDVRKIKDSSQNGLQVEGKKEIKKICFGVSISLELIKKAVKSQSDMIIVHHGLLWRYQRQRFTGPFREKIKLLIENNVNLAAYHLPLDKHPVVGNNAQIIGFLGAKNIKPFGTYENETIGFMGTLKKVMPIKKISKILSEKLGSKQVCFDFGPKKIKSLGVISGGAQKMFDQAIEKNLDLYITGEVSEFVQETARENKINFISAGHYNSEKAGIFALRKLLTSRFRIKTEFMDIPNPI
jgi:dinuclear metal center YbgI/SA1388 family protein